MCDITGCGFFPEGNLYLKINVAQFVVLARWHKYFSNYSVH